MDTKNTGADFFCAIVFIIFLVIIFLINLFVFTLNTVKGDTVYYSGIHEVLDENFALVPGEKTNLGLRQLFGIYSTMTNRTVINGVVLLDDGRKVLEIKPDLSLTQARADIIIELGDYLSEKGIPLLFVRAPDAVQDVTELPLVVKSGSTVIEDIALFIEMLRLGGVDVLDMREVFERDNIDFTSVFYRGDLHWNTRGIFYTYGKLGPMINDLYGFDLDETTWDVNAYKHITYSGTFVGGLSRRTDGKREDVYVMLPDYDTLFDVLDVETGDILATGDYVEVFTPSVKNGSDSDFGILDLNATPHEYVRRYINLLAPNNIKVLFIADSFGNSLATYLSTAVNSLDHLFLNSTHSPKIYPLLKTNEYDIVIFLAYDGVIASDDVDLGTGRFNFGMDN